MSNSLLTQLLAQKGESLADTLSYSNLGKLVRRQGVKAGPEFTRIKQLPRRKWEEDPDLEQLIDALTDWLLVNKDPCPGGVWQKRKGGVVCSECGSPQRLRPHQAKGLQELHDYGGKFFADFPVGEGKTLVSFLAPVVLARGLGIPTDEVKPLLLLPAKLEDKTIREFKKLANHWAGYRKIERLSYEKFSREKQVDFLERYEPRLIMADEAYKLKNASGARAKRIRRFRKTHPTTCFLPLTGTPWKDSVHDYAHLSEWALQDLSPVPHAEEGYVELCDWANCVDVTPRETRLAAGALAELCPTPPTSVEDVRAALALRRNETPGWVRVTSSGVDASLTLQGVKFDDYAPHVEAKFAALRHDYETPDGLAFTEPSKLWSYLRCCSAEFWYRYDPPPPQPWKDARRAWGSLVRDTIAHNRHHWDTEHQIALACQRGQIAHGGAYDDWVRIRPSYKPEAHKLTEWFGDSFIGWCVNWLEREKSILFTSLIAVGDRLKKETGLPYFHEGGIDPDFGSIEDWKGGPCIASVDSNKEGRNIQHLWHKACVVGGLASGPDAEQLIGRLHRPGTEADVVEYTFPYGCLEVFETLHNAREQAAFSDNPLHKLILGDFLIDSRKDAEKWKGKRWQKIS